VAVEQRIGRSSMSTVETVMSQPGLSMIESRFSLSGAGRGHRVAGRSFPDIACTE
jgi:hypothetical protein